MQARTCLKALDAKEPSPGLAGFIHLHASFITEARKRVKRPHDAPDEPVNTVITFPIKVEGSLSSASLREIVFLKTVHEEVGRTGT